MNCDSSAMWRHPNCLHNLQYLGYETPVIHEAEWSCLLKYSTCWFHFARIGFWFPPVDLKFYPRRVVPKQNSLLNRLAQFNI